jgi:disulfide bond formation protein DsbB
MSNFRNYLKSSWWDSCQASWLKDFFGESVFWTNSFLLIAALTLSILISAFCIDWLLGFDPCILCIYARIPYGILLVLSLIGAKITNDIRIEKFTPYLLSMMIITVLAGLSISIYHTGVERHLWEATSHCSPNISLAENTTLEEFRKQLDNAKIGDCSKPAFYVFGLSLAEANIILNFVFMIYFIMLFKKHLTKIRPKHEKTKI